MILSLLPLLLLSMFEFETKIILGQRFRCYPPIKRKQLTAQPVTPTCLELSHYKLLTYSSMTNIKKSFAIKITVNKVYTKQASLVETHNDGY